MSIEVIVNSLVKYFVRGHSLSH